MPNNQRDNPMIEAALGYTKGYGYLPPLRVFPCGFKSKVPAISKENGGNGFHDATTDIEIIKKRWSENPNFNIGIATGEVSEIVVIDSDVSDTKHGDEELEALQEEYGKLPDTVTVITGGGGTHRYYRYPKSHFIGSENGQIPFKDGTKAQWVDFKGNGGYVLAPPSIHKNGNRYEWEVSSLPEDTPIVDLPEPWVKLLESCSCPTKKRKANKPLKAEISEGSRNQSLFKYAASLRRKGMEQDEILKLLIEENKTRCNPPLSERELQQIQESVLRYPQGGEKKPTLDIASMEEFLSESGISVRLNVINHEIEISGVGNEFNPETIGSELHIILHDQLKQQYKCDKNGVADMLGVIAGKNRFNPVVDMLSEVTWDGFDRMKDLFEIIGISPEDELSKTLVSKWLCQCVAMAYNDPRNPYGADGLLVLQGQQGVGKTTFVSRLCMGRHDLFKLGQYLDARDKDTSRRCTSAWIVELGEVETTLRSDLERLKAFVTAERDEYRLPYGRSDQVLTRRTSLIATCNSERFLIDPTGSRRFWTVPISKIDLDALNEFDFLQLWAEIASYVSGNRQYFRLTPEEQKELALRNSAHEKPLKSQLEIEDILAEAAEKKSFYEWQYMTVSAFKTYYDTLKPYSVEQIAKALDKIGITTERKSINGKQSRVRRLPGRRWNATSTVSTA